MKYTNPNALLFTTAMTLCFVNVKSGNNSTTDNTTISSSSSSSESSLSSSSLSSSTKSKEPGSNTGYDIIDILDRIKGEANSNTFKTGTFVGLIAIQAAVIVTVYLDFHIPYIQ